MDDLIEQADHHDQGDNHRADRQSEQHASATPVRPRKPRPGQTCR
jgi:hypothetical protein